MNMILKNIDWQKPHQPNLTGTKEAYYPNKDKNEPEKNIKAGLINIILLFFFISVAPIQILIGNLQK